MRHEKWKDANKVAVIGAGTMGSGIAAHCANLGMEVLLFDVSTEAVHQAFERAKGLKPPHFFNHESIERITLCSIESDIAKVSEADWVCEAVIEKMDVKRHLYEMIEPYLREDAMISTNTSGLEIRLLAEGRRESFRKRFLGTHFFNPPRYLKLIELIPTDETERDVVSAITEFLEDKVGRRVVLAKDTPGFIANRFGMWALYQAIHSAEKLGFNVETVDAIAGTFIGRPRTGVFRLCDLIGLDIMQDVAINLQKRCTYDENVDVLSPPSSLTDLMEAGRIGSKVGSGYYKREGSDYLVYDFNTHSYRPQINPELPTLNELKKQPLSERLRNALERRDEAGEFLRMHLIPVLEYAAFVADEIAYTAEDFDRVMKWGWGWELGPFELIDALGTEVVKAHSSKPAVFSVDSYYTVDESYNFDKKAFTSRDKNEKYIGVENFHITKTGTNWSLRDDGEGGVIFEWNTKMNVLNPDVLKALNEVLEKAENNKVFLMNTGKGFSAGFDLGMFLKASEEGRFNEVESWLIELQNCSSNLSVKNSVAGVYGFCLGGGLELAMHCQKIVAAPETQVGLPETSVGLVPAGGGTTLMRLRTQHDAKLMCKAILVLGTGSKVSAFDAHKESFFLDQDVVVTNADQLVYRTIKSTLTKRPVPEWHPAPPLVATMVDSELTKMKSTNTLGSYGMKLVEEIKHLFLRTKSKEDCLAKEREVFLQLLGTPMTQARIKHMMETGKPLNN